MVLVLYFVLTRARIYRRRFYNPYYYSHKIITISSPYFQTALEVLSLLDDNENSVEKICYMVNINSTQLDNICNSLKTWNLITENGFHHILTRKGCNLLSYYRTSETFFDKELKPQNKLQEIRSRVSKLRDRQ